MPREPRPWYRSDRDAWYVKLGGKKVMLAKGRQSEPEAWAAFRRLQATAGPLTLAPGRLRVRELVEGFLDHFDGRVSRGERARVTYDGYAKLLSRAIDALGSLRAAELRPYHVGRWLDGKAWGPTTRHNAARALKIAFRWAAEAGLIEADPLARMPVPEARRRTNFPEGILIRALIHALDEGRDPLADLLRALYLTGLRIGEVVGIRARDLVPSVQGVQVRDKGARGPGDRRRLAHLSSAAAAFLARLAEGRDLDDHLLLNRVGRPWTNNAVGHATRHLARSIGLPPGMLTPHGLRHRFGVDALGTLGDASTVAALLGHRSPRMVNEVYGHWNLQGELLRRAADRVRPE